MAVAARDRRIMSLNQARASLEDEIQQLQVRPYPMLFVICVIYRFFDMYTSVLESGLFFRVRFHMYFRAHNSCNIHTQDELMHMEAQLAAAATQV